MLTEWLGPAALDEVCARSLRTAPDARPATALAARGVLDWEILDRVLRTADDVLVVARGQLLPVPPPRSNAELRGYLAAGIGLCARRAERHDPGLAAVAAAFGELGRAHVQLFVTPGGTH